MLALFRREFPGIQLLLLAYTLLLRIAGFAGKLKTTQTDEHEGYLFQLVANTADTHPYWIVLSALCIWLQAILLNWLAIRHKIAERKSWFVAVIYVFFASFWLETQMFNGLLLGLFFYIIALSQLFSTFRAANCRKEIFNIGFLISLSALFSPTLIWFAIPFYLGISSLRSFKLVEQSGFFVGLLIPMLLVWGGAFLYDDTNRFITSVSFRGFSLPALNWPLPPASLASFALFILAILFVLLSTFRFLSKRGIQSQKYFAICYWLLIAGVLIIAFRQPFNPTNSLILVPTLAVFIGITVEESRNHQVLELIHLLLLVALFFTHFFLTSL